MSIDTKDHTGTGPRVEVYPGKEVVVDFDPGLTFECVDGCTWCCHRGVLLTGADLLELGARESLEETTTAHGDVVHVRREPKDREEHVDVDGEACYFLDGDGRCILQAEHDWKPTRCSIFPLHVTLEGGDLHVRVRDDARKYCDGLTVSERRIVDHLDAFLPEVLWELDPDTDRTPGA